MIFFDEINTNDNLAGLLKHLLLDRNLEGNKISDEILILAACNPYKKKPYQKEIGLKNK